MDFDFRLLLVVAGLGLIGYVAWDGWRNRARNNYKFKLERNLPPDAPERSDREGFNQDGVGRPRVREHGQRLSESDDSDFATGSFAEKSFVPESRSRAEFRAEHVEPTFNEGRDDSRDAAQPPARAAYEPIRGVTPDLFGGDEPEPPVQTRRDARHERSAARKADPDVIALTVLAPEGQQFRGADLVACLLEHDLRFGEMDIFHRHADASGQGSVLFSVANALKPGTFDPDNMDNFSSPGVSLFMQLPGPQDPRSAYHLMLSTAEQIAHALGGDVRDASRKPLSTEVRLRHQEILAEHERQLFAGA
jgi:cell division protein ZipA